MSERLREARRHKLITFIDGGDNVRVNNAEKQHVNGVWEKIRRSFTGASDMNRPSIFEVWGHKSRVEIICNEIVSSAFSDGIY